MSDFVIHFMVSIIGEAGSIRSRARAQRAFERTPAAGDGLWLAPAKPVLRILDRIDPLAKLAAKLRFPATAGEISNPVF
jgi:hypothetical protein